MNLEKLKKWKRLQATLKTIKSQEMNLRKEIAAEILDGQIGTVNMVFDKYKIKAVQQTRVKIDNDALLAIWSDLSADCQAAINWKPELSKREYKNIDINNRSMLDSVLTTVPNAPTLTITENK